MDDNNNNNNNNNNVKEKKNLKLFSFNYMPTMCVRSFFISNNAFSLKNKNTAVVCGTEIKKQFYFIKSLIIKGCLFFQVK